MLDHMPDTHEKSLFSKTGFFFDLGLAAVFFVFMREILVPHVPSQDPETVLIISSMTSFSIAGVFWIATNMLRVTWVDYSRRKKQKK